MQPDDRRLKIKERIKEIMQHIPEDVLEHLLEVWLWEIDELLKTHPELLRHIQVQLDKESDFEDNRQ